MATIPPLAFGVTIELLRARIGLAAGDTTRDGDLAVAYEMTVDLVELYLDRKLTYAKDLEYFSEVNRSVQVRRYPIDRDQPLEIFNGNLSEEEVQWILNGDPQAPSPNRTIGPDQYGIDANGGIIHAGLTSRMHLAYAGGFKYLPPTLMWALVSAFDALWASTSGFGAASGGAGLVQGTGEVKKISLVGIGSIDYDVGATVVGGGGSASSGDPWGILPGAVITVLDRWRRESVIGVG